MPCLLPEVHKRVQVTNAAVQVRILLLDNHTSTRKWRLPQVQAYMAFLERLPAGGGGCGRRTGGRAGAPYAIPPPSGYKLALEPRAGAAPAACSLALPAYVERWLPGAKNTRMARHLPEKCGGGDGK